MRVIHSRKRDVLLVTAVTLALLVLFGALLLLISQGGCESRAAAGPASCPLDQACFTVRSVAMETALSSARPCR